MRFPQPIPQRRIEATVLLAALAIAYGQLDFSWSVFAACFFLPDLWLWLRRRARMRRIRESLSYAVDLLVALLHAGLGLEKAFRRVASEGLDRDHPLGQEMALVASELEAGADRNGLRLDRPRHPATRSWDPSRNSHNARSPGLFSGGASETGAANHLYK